MGAEEQRAGTGRRGEVAGGGPDPAHQRPEGLDEVTVEALGKLSEALETVERARGHLYSLHQLIGMADFGLDQAVSLFMQAGHTETAERIHRELIGRNVIPGHWTFQIVEEFDDGYYAEFREVEREARNRLAGGRRHLYEAALKERRRTHGRPGHEACPGDAEQPAGANRDRSAGPEQPAGANRDRSAGPEQPAGANRDRSAGPEQPADANRDRSAGVEQTAGVDRSGGAEQAAGAEQAGGMEQAAGRDGE
jgi:hypothetical protein